MKTIMCLMLTFAVGVMCSTGEGSTPETSFMQGMLELPDASASTQFTSVTEARSFGDRWLGAQRRQTGHRHGDNNYRAAAIAFRKGAAAARRGRARSAMRAFRAAKSHWAVARNRYLSKVKRGGRRRLRAGCHRVRRCHVRKCRKKKREEMIQDMSSEVASASNAALEARRRARRARRGRCGKRICHSRVVCRHGGHTSTGSRPTRSVVLAS